MQQCCTWSLHTYFTRLDLHSCLLPTFGDNTGQEGLRGEWREGGGEGEQGVAERRKKEKKEQGRSKELRSPDRADANTTRARCAHYVLATHRGPCVCVMNGEKPSHRVDAVILLDKPTPTKAGNTNCSPTLPSVKVLHTHMRARVRVREIFCFLVSRIRRP